MEVDRNVQVLQDSPQRIVVGVIKRFHPCHVGGDGREEDTAAQTLLLDPCDIGDGVADVVEEELTHACALGRSLGAEVHQPSIMCLDAGPPVLVLLGRWRSGEEDKPRIERRHRVGVDHLPYDAVGEFVGRATLVVPVADT